MRPRTWSSASSRRAIDPISCISRTSRRIRGVSPGIGYETGRGTTRIVSGAPDAVSFHVQPDTLDAKVPNLLLQPLVENAIRHGIAPNARPGWLTINASRTGDDLTIEIRDSGNGLPPERLMALNRGVGLDNTRARLERLYRSEYGFTFANVPNGFSVVVTIPFRAAAPPTSEPAPVRAGVA